MGGSSAAPPPLPDPEATIAAQTQANRDAVRESARVNAVDITGPFGRTYYRRNDDGTPSEQITELNEGSQYIYDRQQDIGGRLMDTASNRLTNVAQDPYTTRNLPYNPADYDTNSMPTWSATSVGRPQPASFGGSRMVALGSDGYGNQAPQVDPDGKPVAALGPRRSMVALGSEPGPVVFGGAEAPGGGITGRTPIALGSNPQSAGQYDMSVMPYDPRSYGSIDAFRSSIGDSMYDQGMSRLQPQIESQDRAFDQKMADRGIPVGSEAYTRALEAKNRGQNDLRSTLANQSNIASLDASRGILGMEQGLRSTAWNENMTGSQQEQADWLRRLGTEQDLRQRVNTDNLAERNQTINEIAMILGGSPQMQMPTAPSMANYNVQAPDVAGITNAGYNAQMASYQAQQAQRNSMLNGIMGIGASSMPFILSHSSLKHDIRDA